MDLFNSCKVSSRDGARRLEETRLVMQRDLEKRDNEARQLGRLVEDCGDVDSRLRGAYQQRLGRLRADLKSLRNVGYEKSSEVMMYRVQEMDQRRAWVKDKRTMVTDIESLEEHICELHVGVEELEVCERGTTRECISEEVSVAISTTKMQELQTEIGSLEMRAQSAESDACELGEALRMLGRRTNSEAQTENAALETLLTDRLMTASQRPLDSLERRHADAECRIIGEEARQATNDLHDAQADGLNAEEGLQNALQILQQQQDLLEWQLKVITRERDDPGGGLLSLLQYGM